MSVPGLLHACGRIFWKLKTVLKRIFLFFAIWIGTWDLQTWTTFVKIFCIVILAEKNLFTFLLPPFLTIILWNSFISDFVFKFTLNTGPKRKKNCKIYIGMETHLNEYSHYSWRKKQIYIFIACFSQNSHLKFFYIRFCFEINFEHWTKEKKKLQKKKCDVIIIEQIFLFSCNCIWMRFFYVKFLQQRQ